MKKDISGYYIPNKSEIKAAAAHARKLQREAGNRYYIGCYFNAVTGKFDYHQYTSSGGWTMYNDVAVYIPNSTGTNAEGTYSSTSAILKEIKMRILLKVTGLQ